MMLAGSNPERVELLVPPTESSPGDIVFLDVSGIHQIFTLVKRFVLMLLFFY